MNLRSTPSLRQEQQEKALFLFVVIAGYIVTVTVASNGGMQYTGIQLLLGIFLGRICLTLGIIEAEILRRFSTTKRNALFFSSEIALVIGIVGILEPGGNWWIGLQPLKTGGFWTRPEPNTCRMFTTLKMQRKMRIQS